LIFILFLLPYISDTPEDAPDSATKIIQAILH
jgi:hypothetical protein